MLVLKTNTWEKGKLSGKRFILQLVLEWALNQITGYKRIDLQKLTSALGERQKQAEEKAPLRENAQTEDLNCRYVVCWPYNNPPVYSLDPIQLLHTIYPSASSFSLQDLLPQISHQT